MKHVSIISLYDATMTSIDSSHQLFTCVNDFMKYQGKPPYYNVEIVGLERRATLNGGLYQIQVNKNIKEVAHTDLVVIPL